MQKTIYHYTSGDALKSIVENKKLWFSDIRCMNDYGEQTIFLNAVKKQASLQNIPGIPSNICDAYDEMVNQSLIEADKKERCFILSCSCNGDFLPMWNYYSKGCLHGGYNIEFNVEAIVKYIYDNFVSKIDGAKLVFGSVFYFNESDNSIDDFLDCLQKHLYGELSKNIQDRETFTKNLAKSIMPILDKIIPEETKCSNLELMESPFAEELNSYLIKCENINTSENKIHVHLYDGTCTTDYYNTIRFIKSNDFAHENEFRVAIIVPVDKIKEINTIFHESKPYKTRYQNGIYIPYLDLNINIDSFVSAKIAPTNFTMNPEENLKEFLLDNKINIDVDKSKITVRY